MFLKKLNIEVATELPKKKNVSEYIRYLMFKKLDINMMENGKFSFDVSPLMRKLEEDGFSAYARVVPSLLNGPDVQSVWLEQEFFKGMKVYVPSNPLVEVLSGLKVDLTQAAIPTGSSGYFELSGLKTEVKTPEHWRISKVGHILYKVLGERIIIGFESVDRREAGSSFSLKLDEANNLEKFKFSTVDEVSKKAVEYPFSEGDINALTLAFNLIAYATGASEELKSQVSKFARGSLGAIQRKSYTSRPFTLIGWEAEFLKIVNTDKEFSVRGHWRWQPCGVGNLLRKLIFIKPHTRGGKHD